MVKLELLAPARDLETGKIAIDYGADAIYIGAPKFGARHEAGNSLEDIAKLIDYARGFGVKVHVALNTIVFENELEEAEGIARQIVDLGADALIVQDMAYRRMELEGIEFHASTQMCNTTAEGVKFLEESGFSRVILERGLTLEQIKNIRKNTQVDLECFIHGAICVGFSGQCYLSRSMGPRSGNRGECSQPCRLTYDLVDEKGKVMMERKHLLSVQDMNYTPRIGELIEAGITSFKIEGRLKDSDYVKNIVAHYRQVLDREITKREGYIKQSSGNVVFDFSPNPNKSFTRGGSLWMIDGAKRGVASFDTPKAIGEGIGRITNVGKDYFQIKGNVELSAGDGICFFASKELVGTNINKSENGRIYPNKMDGLSKGIEIYRNHDRVFFNTLQNSRTKRVVDVKASVTTSLNGIHLTLTDEDSISIELPLEAMFEKAKNPGMMVDTIQEQIAKAGDTIFNISEVVVLGDGKMPFVPIAVINGLRREATKRLLEKRKEYFAQQEKANPIENHTYPYPTKSVGGVANVVNSLAKQFYKEHGVEEVAKGLDLNDSYDNEIVMTTPYCIRREIGECLKEKPTYRGELYLERGTYRYRLCFDCNSCLMRIVKE